MLPPKNSWVHPQKYPRRIINFPIPFSPRPMDNIELYRTLFLIRCFEETVLANFPKGVFFGTTHTYLGQEANAVGVLSCRQEGDVIFSNHRCHGHFLAYGGDPRALFAELRGRSTGVCGGRGGSQHLQWRDFYSNGVQGGIVPVAAGMALAEKLKSINSVTIVFVGDGTLGEGALYEALNLSSLWQVPILFVLENNAIAQTTPVELAVAGGIPQRFEAFGIPTLSADTSDVLEILALAQQLIDQARSQPGPRALVLHTYRFGPHSKGDDTRDPTEVARMQAEHDPLRLHAPRLDPEVRRTVEQSVQAQIEAAFQQALQDPYPTL